jgi:hypothetical protein
VEPVPRRVGTVVPAYSAGRSPWPLARPPQPSEAPRWRARRPRPLARNSRECFGCSLSLAPLAYRRSSSRRRSISTVATATARSHRSSSRGDDQYHPQVRRPELAVASRPMPTLRAALDSLASSFASDVLSAIRGASLQELLAESGDAPRRGPGRSRGGGDGTGFRPSKKSHGRLARRSPAEIARTLDAITILLRKNTEGLRSEQIRHALKLDVREVPRVLKEGLAKKKLKSRGQKRATTYTAA